MLFFTPSYTKFPKQQHIQSAHCRQVVRNKNTTKWHSLGLTPQRHTFPDSNKRYNQNQPLPPQNYYILRRPQYPPTFHFPSRALRILQNTIDKIHNWLSSNGFRNSVQKTEFITFKTLALNHTILPVP